jgi:type I restriction-modification system DNA methylase subunit
MAPSNLPLIQRTVDILNSVDYSKYARAKNYLEYAQQSHADERRLIQPIIFRKFVEQVLAFALGQTIWAEESEEGNAPDFVPVDTYTHPFVFDTKSTAATEATLKKFVPQIKRYIRSHRVRYGILTNMRELDVYTEEASDELEEFDFSFLVLYKDFKADGKNILEKENTKRFLRFVETFSFRSLSSEDKINRIVKSPSWTGDDVFNVNHLTTKLKEIVDRFEQDALRQRQIVELFAEQNPDLARDILRELDFISKEIDPSLADEVREIKPEGIREFLGAAQKSTLARATGIYFYRVSYFAMARILLARVWEDIGFIESTLANGGFERWYKNLGKELGRVLKQAFHFASEKYEWLYKTHNNYTWYEPSEQVLVDALYELSNFYLGGLKDDALGMIYEQELDRVDKQNKGQYYTDRALIKFMWDRVGYKSNKAFFREESRKLVPKKVLDPASGSGGFLVEAARRLREYSSPKEKSFDDWLLIRNSILFGLYGVELSPFPYYITEINLLIQFTPVIRELKKRRSALKEGTPIAVIQGDALRIFNEATELFVQEETRNYEVGNHLIRFGRDSAKQRIFERIHSSSDFDYCLANPPYIREDDHKELFRRTKKLPIGRAFYQGKMDYYHFFIELGLSKLREGGLLCFITTSYWLDAVGASNLRRYILDNALVREVIHFGPTKLFESAKGQFNVIFTLEKRPEKHNAERRRQNRIKVAQVKRLFSTSIRENVARVFRHLSSHIEQEVFSDDYLEVYESATPQAELNENEWHLFVHRKHKRILDEIEKIALPLSNFCDISQGFVSGADTVTKENMELLTRNTIEEHSIKIGDGIFYVTATELQTKIRPTAQELELVKKLFKASEQTPYLPSSSLDSDLFCLYVDKNRPIRNYPHINQHLSKFRNILERKREFQEGKLPWYSLHWARSAELFRGEKLSVSIWPATNTFGYSEAEYFAERNIFIIKRKKDTVESLKYILGVLNSKIITFYFERKGSKRGDKYFFPKDFCEKIPIKPIRNKEDKKIHDKIVALVDQMIGDRNKLLAFTRFICDEQYISRKYFDESLPTLNEKQIVHSLGWNAARPLNRHGAVKYSLGTIDPDAFTLNSVQIIEATLFEERPSIRLVAVDGSVLELHAEKEIVGLLQNLLSEYKGQSLKDILQDVELPLRSAVLQEKKSQISRDIRDLTRNITKLQQKIDELVMRLYGVTI